MVRSWLSTPTTTLPDELVNATCWNHPSRTSMLIGVVGSTSVALSAGRTAPLASAGGLAFSDCLVDPPKHAANTLGAKTPTARVARARRRVTGEKPRAVSTTNQDTGENDLTCARALQRAADQHRFGYQCDTKHIADPVTHCARQRHHVGGAGSAAIGQSKRMLGGQPTARGCDVRIALSEAGLLDEPTCGQFYAVRSGIVRHRAIDAVGHLLVTLLCDNGIGEERSHAPGVVVGRVENHALSGAQRQYRIPDRRRIGPLAGRGGQRGHQLAVAQRRAAGRG